MNPKTYPILPQSRFDSYSQLSTIASYLHPFQDIHFSAESTKINDIFSYVTPDTFHKISRNYIFHVQIQFPKISQKCLSKLVCFKPGTKKTKWVVLLNLHVLYLSDCCFVLPFSSLCTFYTSCKQKVRSKNTINFRLNIFGRNVTYEMLDTYITSHMKGYREQQSCY